MSDAPTAPTATDPAASDDPEVVREQIAETREALGETVDALVAKTDVKARVSAKVDDQREKVAAQAQTLRDNPLPLGAALAALLTAIVAVLLLRRSRH